MEHITEDNILDFSFINLDTLEKPIKAVCVELHGFTDSTMYEKSPKKAEVLGRQGIVWVFPYYSVWAWMSKSSLQFIEQVLDAVYKKLKIVDSTPLIITGGSMGGLTAICYQIYGKRKAVACAANCPVTDMALFYERSIRSRRAILSAHILDETPLEKITYKYSPINLVEKLPKIPYLLVFGGKDGSVTEEYWDVFLKKMSGYGHYVKPIIHEDMDHCDIDSHTEVFDAWCDFIINHSHCYDMLQEERQQ